MKKKFKMHYRPKYESWNRVLNENIQPWSRQRFLKHESLCNVKYYKFFKFINWISLKTLTIKNFINWTSLKLRTFVYQKTSCRDERANHKPEEDITYV